GRAYLERGADPNRQRYIAPCDVTRWEPVCDRDVKVSQNLHDYFFQRIALIVSLNAVEHLAEHDSLYIFQFAGEFELHQHAIDLVRLGSNILEEQDCARGSNLVRSAKGSDENGKAAAVQDAFRLPLAKRLDTTFGFQ